MSTVIFNNKDGSLTDYSLSCGYIHRLKVNNSWLELYKEHNMYHVKAFDFTRHEQIMWDSFESLTRARKQFYRSARHLFELTQRKAIELSCKK